jgi:hypothetical protein
VTREPLATSGFDRDVAGVVKSHEDKDILKIIYTPKKEKKKKKKKRRKKKQP